jgi:ankyrin repeat protein
MAQGKDRELLDAVTYGHLDSVRRLLKEGADPKARDEQGRTGLHIAMTQTGASYSGGGRELAAIFMNRGVDVNDRDSSGAAPLHHAVRDEGYYTTMRISDLLTFGADLEARDSRQRTPLHCAALKGKKADAVKLMIEKGAEVNVADEGGATPLHYAAKSGDVDAIRLLIKAGADLEARTREGKTVWDYAVEGGQDYQAQSLKAEAAENLRRQEQQRREEQRRQEAEKPRDPWSLLGPEKVAHASTEKQIGYRLTEIFNFSARTYTQISQNLSSKAESVAVKTFDEFDDKTSLERAWNELDRLGGKAERASIHGPVVDKPRKGLQLPRN